MSKKVKKKKPSAEAELISRCVKTAGDYGAVIALYKADPSDDDFCAEMADRHLRAARKALIQISEMKATSLLALSAKARLARVAVADDFDMMEESLAVFLQSFIVETIELVNGLADEQRFAEKAAAREARIASRRGNSASALPTGEAA